MISRPGGEAINPSRPYRRRRPHGRSLYGIAGSGGDTRQLQFEAGSHRRAQADLLDEGALDTRRLRPADRAYESAYILEDGLLRKTCLADARLHDAGFFRAKLDLTAFGRLHG